MIDIPGVQKSYLNEEVHAKYYQERKTSAVPNYDMLL